MKRIFAIGLCFALLVSFTACEPIEPVVPQSDRFSTIDQDERELVELYLTTNISPAFLGDDLTAGASKLEDGTFSGTIYLEIDSDDISDVKLYAGNLYHKIMADVEYEISHLRFTLLSGGEVVGAIFNSGGDKFSILLDGGDLERFSVTSSSSSESVKTDDEPTSANPLMEASLNVQTPTADPSLAKGIKYAYITVTKSELISATQEQFAEFVSARIDGSGYNWVSIVCEDGTGICFTGSSKDYASYGPVDALGRVTTSDEMIIRKGDGTYQYVTDKK